MEKPKCSRTQTCEALGIAEGLRLSFKFGCELSGSQSKKGDKVSEE